MRLDDPRIDDRDHRDRCKERPERLFQLEANQIRFRRGDRLRFDDGQKWCGWRFVEPEQALKAVDNIGGRKLAAIMEFDALPQLQIPTEAVCREAV